MLMNINIYIYNNLAIIKFLPLLLSSSKFILQKVTALTPLLTFTACTNIISIL